MEGILIDPVLETLERDMAMVAELGVTIKYMLNTHVHADHVTSTGEIKKRVRENEVRAMAKAIALGGDPKAVMAAMKARGSTTKKKLGDATPVPGAGDGDDLLPGSGAAAGASAH